MGGDRIMRRRMRLVCATLSALAACAACLLYGKHVKAQAEQVRIDALERYGGEVVNLLVATRTLEYGDIIDSGSVASREGSQTSHRTRHSSAWRMS